MKILLDECVDRRFARELSEHDVVTVPQQGWAGVKNGSLMKLAEPCGQNQRLGDPTHNLNLNETDLSRPKKPDMEGPKTAAEEMQIMRKLYQQMFMDKNQIKGKNLVQIGRIKREKKADKEMAVAE